MLFNIDDFVKTTPDILYSGYTINKECTVFNKILEPTFINFSTNKIDNISKNISEINKYLNWLAFNCRDNLINTFCEIVSSWDINKNITPKDQDDLNWYESLDILDITIFVSEDGLTSRIYCRDNYNQAEYLEIEVKKNRNFVLKYTPYGGFFRKFHSSTEISRQEKPDEHDNNDLDYEPDKDKTDKISDICSVHHCKMKMKKIKIMYGYPIGPVYGYDEDRENLFPNCDDKLLGGCCIDDDSETHESKYVCKLCNQSREEWKIKHRSEIFFHLHYTISENVIMYLNDDICFPIKKDNYHDDYWVGIIAIPNAAYKIIAKNKLSGVVLAEIDVSLNNELLSLYFEKNTMKNSYNFKIDHKDKMNALWY